MTALKEMLPELFFDGVYNRKSLVAGLSGIFSTRNGNRYYNCLIPSSSDAICRFQLGEFNTDNIPFYCCYPALVTHISTESYVYWNTSWQRLRKKKVNLC